MDADQNIFLVGPMGSGKTAVGQRLAQLLDREFVDTDREIESRCGVDVAYIFEKEGESGFRQREYAVLADFARRSGLVIATGGGIVSQPDNRNILSRSGVVIYLETSVDQQHARTQHNNTRPLLHGVNPIDRLRELFTLREPLYHEVADVVVNTDGQRVHQVAARLQAKLRNFKKAEILMHTITVDLGARSYPIHIGKNLLGNAHAWQQIVSTLNLPQRLLVVSDDNVAPRYLQQLASGLPTHQLDSCVLAHGEARKNFASLTTILDQLVGDGFQRDAVVIALGGGVIGDMAGFASACFMRGIRFLQVPTTLLAQVDSSVGGKTGINHPLGKNLIGAFHQPVSVLIDTDTLHTLDKRQVRAGLAEVIKYGCIFDAGFFDWLEKNMSLLLALDDEALAYAITRSCEIKARIVANDEIEAGERALLNFGHSFGHAIEQVNHYTKWLHGEAVAIGMLMAASLSCKMGLLSATQLARISALVQAAGLPTATGGASVNAMLEAMNKDKKNTATVQRLILLHDIGKSAIHTDCQAADIEDALAAYNTSS